MAVADAWIAVLAVGAVTQVLRYLPVVLLRWRGENLPPAIARTLESAGMATIGGLIALAVFRPSPGADGMSGVDIALKLFALALGFVLYVRFRRSVPALLVAYGVYVLLALAVPSIG